MFGTCTAPGRLRTDTFVPSASDHDYGGQYRAPALPPCQSNPAFLPLLVYLLAFGFRGRTRWMSRRIHSVLCNFNACAIAQYDVDDAVHIFMNVMTRFWYGVTCCRCSAWQCPSKQRVGRDGGTLSTPTRQTPATWQRKDSRESVKIYSVLY